MAKSNFDPNEMIRRIEAERQAEQARRAAREADRVRREADWCRKHGC